MANFSVSNGQIIAPNGTTFVGKGINLYDSDMAQASTGSSGAPLTSFFPGINFIRLACYSYQSPSAYSNFISQMSNLGIVVLIENHQNFNADGSSAGQAGGGAGVILTGSLLTTESNWYAALASAYINNPLVWYGTNNEPPKNAGSGYGTPGSQSQLSTWQQATYNAIRGTGNGNIIFMELYGGGDPGTIGNGYGMTSSVYASMTNIVWDMHFYPWATAQSTNQTTVNQTMLGQIAAPSNGGVFGVAACQTITSADGLVPVFIGECGISGDATTLTGGTQLLQACYTLGYGAAAWNWCPYVNGTSDMALSVNLDLTYFGQYLSSYGQIVAGYIASGKTVSGTSNTPSLLPAGPLFTSGNQVVDQNGNPVKIACLGWQAGNGRNEVPVGLNAVSYKTLLAQVISIGFNCVRILTCDAMVANNDYPGGGQINTTYNPDLAGLSVLQVLDTIIAYCGTIGMRVIVDSHNNEGFDQPNQFNGLWYDVGGASDGTDGAGHTGTISSAQFTNLWVARANRWKNLPAILGYDIRNEPNTNSGANWGGGNANTDYRLMYQTVGNAILAVDPRPLIICEGIQNFGRTFYTGTASDGIAYGGGGNFDGHSGDLSNVRSFPVQLNIANKVLYSVHEYPQETTGNGTDVAGTAKIAQMTAVWGYLVKESLAAVWIGEMGSFFNGSSSQQAASTSWMNMMISYMNGKAAGGPSFTGVQQGIGMDWWVLDIPGNEGGVNNVPCFGILTAFAGGTAYTAQYNLYSQLFYTGGQSNPVNPNPPQNLSPNGTTITTVGPYITDANNNTWAINSAGQVVQNGVADTTTANVIELVYISNLVWQENASLLWWSKSVPTDAWLPINGTTVSPLGTAPVPSPNGTIVTTVGPAITDANGNLWAINSSGQVTVNGTADTTTSGIIELVFLSNHIYKESSGLLWQFKTLPTDAWAPVPATTVNPITGITPTPTPSPTPGPTPTPTPTPPPTGPLGSVWNIHAGIAAWTPAANVAMGVRQANNGIAYLCVVAGKTAVTGGPTGTGSNIVDGTAHWAFLSNVDLVTLLAAQAQLPAAFSGSISWVIWNEMSQTTPAATPFMNLTGHVMGAYALTLTAPVQDSVRTYQKPQSVPLAINPTAATCFLQPLAIGASINYSVINDPVVVIDGLQFQDPCSTSNSTIIATNAANTSIVIRNCIFDGYSQTGGSIMFDFNTTGSVLLYNCLIIDRQAANAGTYTFGVTSAVTSFRMVNCTIVAVNSPTSAVLFGGSFTGGIVKNCAVFGYGTTGDGGYTFDHSTTNAASWGSGTDGGNNTFSASAAACFINPASDWRTLPGSPLIGTGVADFTDIPSGDDLAGNPRTQNAGWDQGCYERLAFTPAEIRPQPIKFW